MASACRPPARRDPTFGSRRSRLKLDSLTTLLKSGALLEQGMPRFQQLTDDQIREIYAYIRAKAREALGQRPKDDAAPHPQL